MSLFTNGSTSSINGIPYRARYKASFSGDRSELTTILCNLLSVVGVRCLDIDKSLHLNSIDSRYELATILPENLSLLAYWSVDSENLIEITFDLDSPIPVNGSIDHLFFEPAKKFLPTIYLVYNFLSKPTVTVSKSTHHEDILKNQKWLVDHHQEYSGRWVAIKNGELVADAISAKELLAQVDSTDNTLLTAVY